MAVFKINLIATQHDMDMTQDSSSIISENAKPLYVFCFQTNRLAQSADTIRAYDRNFHKFGHNVPIMVFLDASPDAMKNDKPQFPNYNADYENLKKTVWDEATQTGCHNDVFVVDYEDQRNLLNLIKTKLKEKHPDKHNIIDRLIAPPHFGGGAGGIRNVTLLYTIGSMVLQSEDDMRPIETQSKNFRKRLLPPQPTSRIFETSEYPLAEGEDIYRTLTDFEPGHDVLPPSWEKHGLEIKETNILSAYFSILGLSLSQVKELLPQINEAEMITYNTVDPYLNVTPVNYIEGMLDSTLYDHTGTNDDFHNIPRERNLWNKIGRLSGGWSSGLTIGPYNMIPYGTLRAPDDAKVKFVQSYLNGRIDSMDAIDVLDMWIETSSLSTIDTNSIVTTLNRATFPTIARYGHSLMGGLVGIDNRDGIGPQIIGLRKDDVAYRLEAMEEGSLTVQLPRGQTHLGSTEHRNIALQIYEEQLGTLMNALLINHRNMDGTYEHEMHVTREMTNKLCSYTSERCEKIAEAISACGNHKDMNERKTLLQETLASLEEFYCGFNPEKFYDKAKKEIEGTIESYLSMRDLWPDIQNIVRDNPQVLTLTNLKTNEKTTVAEIQCNPAYSRGFSYEYGHYILEDRLPGEQEKILSTQYGINNYSLYKQSNASLPESPTPSHLPKDYKPRSLNTVTDHILFSRDQTSRNDIGFKR